LHFAFHSIVPSGNGQWNVPSSPDSTATSSASLARLASALAMRSAMRASSCSIR